MRRCRFSFTAAPFTTGLRGILLADYLGINRNPAVPPFQGFFRVQTRTNLPKSWRQVHQYDMDLENPNSDLRRQVSSPCGIPRRTPHASPALQQGRRALPRGRIRRICPCAGLEAWCPPQGPITWVRSSLRPRVRSERNSCRIWWISSFQFSRKSQLRLQTTGYGLSPAGRPGFGGRLLRAEKPSRLRCCSEWLGNNLEHLTARAHPNLVFVRGSSNIDGPMNEVILALEHRLQYGAAANRLQSDRLCPLAADARRLQRGRRDDGGGMRLGGLTDGSGCQHQHTE